MGFVLDLAKSCRENSELLEDLARFSEGIATETAVRRKYRDLLDDEAWELLATDDLLVEMVETRKLQRVRDGSYKRERSQQLVTKAPDVLSTILLDEKNSPKHRIDSAKVLNDFAEGGPRSAHDDSDRFIVTINLGADEKLVFDCGSVKPNPNNTDVIDATPTPVRFIPNNAIDEPPPVRRGPGRPKGSRNKPKIADAEELLPFVTANKPTDGGGNANSL
jgi:hypothetical protein